MKTTTKGSTMKVWQIEDGASHWVVAETAERALQIHIASVARSEAEYIEDCGLDELPVPTEHTTELRVDVTDDAGSLFKQDGWPIGTRVFVEIPPRCFTQLPEGTIASSET